VTPARTLATAGRVLQQLRRDRRSVALMLVVPVVLIALLKWVYWDNEAVFDRIGLPLLGIFPFVTMFLVTSVATLRERQSGTLERLLAMPLGKGDLLLGYQIAFGLFATVQALIAVAVTVGLLGLAVAGPLWAVVLVAILVALLGTAIGLALSALARTEFQAVQFLPAVILPQFLLCGLLAPRDSMQPVLAAISNVLPLSYAVDAMKAIAVESSLSAQTWADMGVMLLFIAGLLVLGAATLRRRTP
jgi:ABC transporter DrrB family efflux protein